MELIFQGQNHLKCCQLGDEGPVWPLSNTAFFFFYLTICTPPELCSYEGEQS